MRNTFRQADNEEEEGGDVNNAKDISPSYLSSKDGREPGSNFTNNEWDDNEDHGRISDRGKGRGRQRQDLRMLHGPQNRFQQNALKAGGENRTPDEHESQEDEDRFEDEEVDVDDLPPDLRKNTLQQRLQEQQENQKECEQLSLETSKKCNQEEMKYASLGGKSENYLPNTTGVQKPIVSSTEVSKTQLKNTIESNHEMDDALVDSLVDSLVNEDDCGSTIVPMSQQHPISSNPSPKAISSDANSNRIQDQHEENIVTGGMTLQNEQLRNESAAQDMVWFYLDPQGNRQGPFSNSDMLDWFNAGYFPTELMLRRAQDKRFIRLIEMTKLYERVPFSPGPWPHIPPPLEDLEELEKQHETERRREAQHQAILQQLQQQALLQQQLQMQQQQLFAVQQQGQNQVPDKAALEQALAAQAQATAQAIRQQQQLMQKMMQNLSMLSQHQNPTAIPQQPEQSQVQQSLSTSPGQQPDQGNLNGNLQQSQLGSMLLRQQMPQEVVHQTSSQSEYHHTTSPHHQSQHSGVGGFGLGISSQASNTSGEETPLGGSHPRSPHQQQPVIGEGMLGQKPVSPLIRSSENISSPSTGGGYDPIKSLLNQLQHSDQKSPSVQTTHESGSAQSSSLSQHQVGGFGISETRHRTTPTTTETQATSIGGTAATESPHMGRSIWDMPAAAAAAPPNPNPALTREQQEHQILHQQQQLLLQQERQREAAKQNISAVTKGAWGGGRPSFLEDQHTQQQQNVSNIAWPPAHQPDSESHHLQPLLSEQQQEKTQYSQISGEDYNNFMNTVHEKHEGSARSSFVHPESQNFDNKKSNENRNILTTDSFSSEISQNNNEDCFSFI